MPKITHLCLPVNSDADYWQPDAYALDMEVLEELKALVKTAQHLNKTMKDFRHIEMNWPYGTWLTVDENIDAPAVFQEQDPSESGWATDYNDDPDLPPLDGFAVQSDGSYIEFRCYEADTGLHSWSEPIYLRGDLVVFRNLAYNMLTGEIAEVDDVQ
jgi:hypothetical protein